MSLVKELIKDLLPEQKYKKTVAVYGGGFKPPTKGHFEVVKQAIKENPDIDEFIINIGGKARDGVTPEEAIQIWDIYKQYLPVSANINIQYSSTPPIKATYDYAKNHPDEEVLFILGAREGNDDDFKDISSRTKSLDKYPNLNLRTIVTQGGVSGTAARNAGKISSEKLRRFLPDELSNEEVEQVYQMISDKLTEGRKKKKDPKKGTGKKPKKSGRRLYTDEDPKDTVGIKFSTRQDIVDTLSKKSFKAKSHARQSQIINLIHQRVRAALGRTKDPKKKAKLQSGFKYIKKRKEASKAKTQRLKKQKLKEQIDSSKFNYQPYIMSLTQHMIDNGLKLEPLPKIQMIHDDYENGEDLFGKTAYYAPATNLVVLYTYGRHPKDILRSYAHELIHVHQNMEDRLSNINTTNVNDDDYLEQLEREAYETGNIMFRSWTDSLTGNKLEESVKKLITEKKKKDPFGLNAYAMELAKGLEEQTSEYKVYLDMDGVLADFDQRFKDISGMEPKEFEAKYGTKEFWNLIDEENKISFWVGIPEMPGAKALVDAVKKYNYELLTSPSAKKQSYLGKILWVRNHSNLFGGKPRINFKRAKEKHEVKPELTKTDILIDDREDTIGRWNAAGGTGIVYKNVGQVLNDLKKLGL
tara:strand:- start:856 stop:2775 length:1920 start_codon:yes stop_codon:yes gene_type:complete